MGSGGYYILLFLAPKTTLNEYATIGDEQILF